MSSIQQKELYLASAKLQAVEQNAALARNIMYEGLTKSKGTEFQKHKTAQLRSAEIWKIFYSYADEDRGLV